LFSGCFISDKESEENGRRCATRHYARQEKMVGDNSARVCKSNLEGTNLATSTLSML
jgi:hypothetical protein